MSDTKIKASKRLDRVEYQKDRYLKCKQKGICPFCSNPARPGKVSCTDCQKKQGEWSRVRKYGITPAQYRQMLAAQDGRCKICAILFGDAKSRDGCVVDHDHDTGKIRALLCQTCNNILGWVEKRSGVDHLEIMKQYVLEKIGDKQRKLPLA